MAKKAKSPEKPVQVNTDFTQYPELLVFLDELVKEEMTDRSKVIRKLLRQEQGRRQQLSLPLPPVTIKKTGERQTVAA